MTSSLSSNIIQKQISDNFPQRMTEGARRFPFGLVPSGVLSNIALLNCPRQLMSIHLEQAVRIIWGLLRFLHGPIIWDPVVIFITSFHRIIPTSIHVHLISVGIASRAHFAAFLDVYMDDLWFRSQFSVRERGVLSWGTRQEIDARKGVCYMC